MALDYCGEEKKRMKICLINNLYPPYNRGGAEQVIVKTVEGLKEAGHDVVLITSSPQHDECTEEQGVRIYRITPPNLFFYTNLHHHSIILRLLWHGIDMMNIRAAKEVKEIIKQEKPDIIHTHNLMGMSFLIPYIIRKLTIRHVHTVHDVQLVEPSAMILKEKEQSLRYHNPCTWVYTQIMKILMGSPNVVISPSQFLKDFYTSRGFFRKSTVEIIRNPMTFTKSLRLESGKKGTKSGITFLYLGQIEEHKGIQTLVKTFSAFKQKEIKLHIVGDGTLLESVKQWTKNQSNIIVHGRKKHEDIPALLKEIDMTIVPSLCYENSPTVIFESFAFGIPVIASDIDGIAELITQGQNGITFHAGNAEDLTEKVTWAITHKEDIEKMKSQTQASLHGLSIDAYIEKLTTHYIGG